MINLLGAAVSERGLSGETAFSQVEGLLTSV